MAVTVPRDQAAAGERAAGLWTGWMDSGLVFTREEGSPLSPEVISRRFKRSAAAACLPVIRFHDLRHTSASLALAAGVAIKVVSDRLGHSTSGITADLYTQVTPAVARDAAEAIASTFADRPPQDVPKMCPNSGSRPTQGEPRAREA